MGPQATQPSADVPEDEPAHIDILRGEIGALLGFGDKPVTNEEEQNVETILRAVQRHYRILGERRALAGRQAREEARDGGGWRVRDLTWIKRAKDWFAPSQVGSYGVGYAGNGYIATLRSIGGDDQLRDRVVARQPTAALAKSAAQADYEARIRSAIEPAALVGGGWKTIDSAPKDGTLILVPVGRGLLDVVSWFDGGWRETTNALRLRNNLTHWMPLPAPPAIEPSPVEGDRR